MIINEQDIKVFTDKSKRKNNDANNELRENIVIGIFNNKIPDNYYKNNNWLTLKKNILNYFEDNFSISSYKYKELIKYGGKSNNYDFMLKLYNTISTRNLLEYKIELKCLNCKKTCKSIKDLPQLLDIDYRKFINYDKLYEEYYYDNYLPNILENTNIIIPDKEKYLIEVKKFNSPLLNDIKKLYNSDTSFKKKVKDNVNKSISEYFKLDTTSLNTRKLLDYILKSQSNKHFMIYSNNNFYYDIFNQENFELRNVTNINNGYKCYIKNNFNLSITLHWKNTTGINNPFIKIRYYKPKLPTIKELKKVADNNNINYTKSILKKELINLLKRNRINIIPK
jgi:hypothetical protein